MTAREKFVRDAIEGGWLLRGALGGEISQYEVETKTFAMKDGNTWLRPPMAVIMLDPTAWQAVGKVRGWGLHVCHYFTNNDADVPMWKCKMHGLIDALAEGKTIDEYLQTI